MNKIISYWMGGMIFCNSVRARWAYRVQDSILLTFAGMNLKTVNNLSAYLSSVVQKFEKLDARRPSTTDELKLCDVLAASAADPKPPTCVSDLS